MHDLLNYASLMPVHLAQMNAPEIDYPVTWEALKSEDFVVAKSDVAFTRLLTDQTLEQEIKMLKRHDGIVGLSQDDLIGLLQQHLTSLILLGSI